MYRRRTIRIAVAQLGEARRDDLLTAMSAEGWRLDLADSLEHLVGLVDAGFHHAAIVLTDSAWQLPKGPMRSLMSYQGSMSLFFLVPGRDEVTGCPSLVGATSDQVLAVDAPVSELVEVIRRDVESAAFHQPEYTILCVDDDPEFLRSLGQFLPPRIEEAFPRFALNFEFCTSPGEALALAQQMPEDRLAVVISDQVMPGIKGVDLLSRIRRVAPRAQRVLLTGHAGLEAAVQAINERAVDKYYSKPIEQSADFITTVRHLLRGYHLQLSSDALRHRLMAQFEFIRVVSAAHTLDKVLQASAMFVYEQIEAAGVAVVLLENSEFVVRATAGDLPTMPVNMAFMPEGSLPMWVMRQRQPVVADHPRDLPQGVQQEMPIAMPFMVVPLVWGDTMLGVIVAAGRTDGRPFSRDERLLMSFIADAASVTIGGLRDRESVEQHYVNTIASLMETMEAKDGYTRGHTDRVMELSMRLAKAAGLRGKELTAVARAAALHDIGKIAVPEWVISKPGRLDSEEFALMRMHCERGAKIVRHLHFLDDARVIILSHHERYDGSGYPQGLKGEEIPLGARILGIVDSYDAMTSDRPYRAAMSPAEAIAEIQANAGKQFDPALVGLFVSIVREMTTGEPATAGVPAAAQAVRDPSMN